MKNTNQKATCSTKLNNQNQAQNSENSLHQIKSEGKTAIMSAILIALIGAIATIIVAVFQWSSTENAKIIDFEKTRKEAAYKVMLSSLNGFYAENERCFSEEDLNRLRYEFSVQMDHCWLYCSDEVVLKASQLMKAVANNSDPSIQTKARNELIYSMRKEFSPESTLSIEDYTHLNPIKNNTQCHFTYKHDIQ